MPLKTLVKVGSLTNLSDARYCAGMGVEMIGFQVVPGLPSYIASEKFQEIRGWISGPAIVAEAHGLTDGNMINKIIEEYKPDYFEFGINDLAISKNLSIPFILVLQPGQTLPAGDFKPRYVVSNENIVLPDGVQLLLGISSVEQAHLASNEVNVSGIAIRSSSGTKFGPVSSDDLASILEVLEED